MSKHLAILMLLLLSVACGSAAAPTLAPTATPLPTLSPAPQATETSLPTSTSTSEPTVTPTDAPAPESPPETTGRNSSALEAVFPEISEKMKDIRPVYTAYFHSEDWQSPGKNTTVDEVFKLLKMDNIVTHEGHQEISPAMVVDHEPDLIIADSILSVVENPALSGLHMITDTAHIPHHIFVMKEGYSFYVADPGFRDTVAAFAAFAYPDTFTFKEGSMDDHDAGHDEPDQGEGASPEATEQEEGGHGHGDGHSHSH